MEIDIRFWRWKIQAEHLSRKVKKPRFRVRFKLLFEKISWGDWPVREEPPPKEESSGGSTSTTTYVCCGVDLANFEELKRHQQDNPETHGLTREAPAGGGASSALGHQEAQGPDTWSCGFCPERFRFKSDWETHLREVHAEEVAS